MRIGVSCYETYDGPNLDIIEFSLHNKNFETRQQIAKELLTKANAISAHIPSLLPIANIPNELAFDTENLVEYFVAHITKRGECDNWKDSWKYYNGCGKKILFENHNQDWHETDAGLCFPEDFKPVADAGYELCLDLGHILYSCFCKSKDEIEWKELANKTFEQFLDLPLYAIHTHTMNEFGGQDHHLSGFDIKPWVTKIKNKFPNITFMVETSMPQYTINDKLNFINTLLKEESTMSFTSRHHNRLVFPYKHLLIVEDIINNQKRVLDHFHSVFDSDGAVQISIVAGAKAAAAIIEQCSIDLIILDHDLPEGNGTDLLNWMREKSIKIPVITFSGIPHNNSHMSTLGATYEFHKEEVINGMADNLIKQILTLNSGVAESYVNTVCINSPTAKRYWVTPEMMLGGSIIDVQDYEHLKKDYFITGVLNVETEHGDTGKTIDYLCETRVPDDGSPFPLEYVRKAALFTDKFLTENKGKNNLYVHCQMGGSRSPAFAYMVLRHHYKMSIEDALGQIRGIMPSGNNYGEHPYHQTYLSSIEQGLASLENGNINVEQNTGIAEKYINKLTSNNLEIYRYWITPTLLIGGNIQDQQDLDHLISDFGVNAIINLDNMQNHEGAIQNLLQLNILDNGDSFSETAVHQVLDFAKNNINRPIYMHCHIGYSRSPHFAYAILRAIYNLSPNDALTIVRESLPTQNHLWGFNRFTERYISSIESALKTYKG